MLRTSAYELAARGDISRETLSHLEKVAAAQTLSLQELVERLEHERLPQADRESTSLKTAAAAMQKQAMSEDVKNMLIGGGIATAAPLAAGALYAGAKGLHSKMTQKRDLKQIMKVHPGLEQYSPHDIQLAFKSIRRFAPEITKDPLAGGNALGTILRARDPMTPGGAPELSGANIAESFSRARPQRDAGIDAVMGAVTGGAGAAQRIRDASQEFARRQDLQKQQADLKFERDKALEAFKRPVFRGKINRPWGRP